MMDWNDYLIGMAAHAATKSKDPSTKVGCVIAMTGTHEVLSTGFNGFPRGVEDDPLIVPGRYLRPAKYRWTEHAERNAIFAAARRGTPLLGSTLYCLLYPCSDCTRAIVQAGISAVVVDEPSLHADYYERWHDDILVSSQMLAEAGVAVSYREP